MIKMNFSGVYQRDKRSSSQLYHPMHNSIASYYTEAMNKTEMKHEFGDDYFIKNLHLIPDPLKRNLADSLFMTETLSKTEEMFQNEPKIQEKVPFHNLNNMDKPRETMDSVSSSRALGGIGAFFSGVVNVLTNVVFRTRSPTNYYDCSDDSQGSQPWQRAKADQDKNGKDRSYDDPPNNVSSDMNDRATVISCESKLNQVLHLLSPRQASTPVWVRKRPKKVFVEPGSVEESFEDAFSPEDFISVPNDSYIEYFSPVQYHFEDTCDTAAQKTKVMAPKEKDISSKSDLELKKDPETELQTSSPQLENNVEQLQLLKDTPQLEIQEHEDKEKSDIKSSLDSKDQLITSCEDKLSRLKAMLQEKRMKCTKRDINPDTSQTTTESKPADKHFKNPSRRCGKRPKTKLKCRIEDDLVFANEVNLGTPPSMENSPMQHGVCFGDYFDEVCGRFRSASTCSEDSFQIVFNDSPKSCHRRTTSDCDSEDSFIIFDDSPESCFTSNDVFGDSDSDSESEISDSGCAVTCKLAHTLTRTVNNLADDSLYEQSEDEVDFVNSVVNRLDLTVPQVEQKTGLLLDDAKKVLRKCQPAKKVQFSTEPPKVHVMRVWAFAARQARAGHWERFAVDRERFKRRIADVEVAVSWVLKPQHRSRVMFQRFMPWWNQLKRKELAEKKEAETRREIEEQKKAEERRLSEERLIEEQRLNEEKLRLNDEEQGLDKQQRTEIQTAKEETVEEEDRRTDEEKLRRDEERIVNDDKVYVTSAIIKEICTNEDKANIESNVDVCKTNSEEAFKEGNEIEFNNNKIINDKITSKIITGYEKNIEDIESTGEIISS